VGGGAAESEVVAVPGLLAPAAFGASTITAGAVGAITSRVVALASLLGAEFPAASTAATMYEYVVAGVSGASLYHVWAPPSVASGVGDPLR
jgi:hypothetical protein